jgi:hypothetical protein
MTAISGISALGGAVSTAVEQFDRALISTVTTVENPDGTTRGPVQVPDGLAGMDTARLAVQAAIAAANASISMLDEVLKLGGYEHKDQPEASQSQASSAARQDPGQSLQLLAFFQSMQAVESSEPAKPEPAQPEPAPSEGAPAQGSAKSGA